MAITEIEETDFNEWLEMALDLWPEDTREEMIEILPKLMQDKRNKNFIYRTESGQAAGFIDMSIRSDYVEGSLTSPVVFIEGIYIKQEYRGKGIARELAKKGEEWGMAMGCTEMGSDAYVANTPSRDFHKSIGFEESEPIVVFIKRIGS